MHDDGTDEDVDCISEGTWLAPTTITSETLLTPLSEEGWGGGGEVGFYAF